MTFMETKKPKKGDSSEIINLFRDCVIHFKVYNKNVRQLIQFVTRRYSICC